MSLSPATGRQAELAALDRYYRFHARIYDASRWSFLFGRSTILHRVAAIAKPGRILEVGCGTGRNLVNLCHRFPLAAVTGLDLSGRMLDVARRKTARFGSRVRLLHQAYEAPLGRVPAWDLVLFSYALTMFNPGWERAIDSARQDLAPGGHVAVVDFHDTRSSVFRRWMGFNHVRIEGQLRTRLEFRFETRMSQIFPAYAGLWRYLLFVGRKP